MVSRFRVEQNRDHFDLLPVISILMCLLGSLLLVTISVATLSIGPGIGEGWLPTTDPNQQGKRPVLVEWDGSVAKIHRENKKVIASWTGWPRTITFGDLSIPVNGNLVIDSHLIELLDELKENKSTHYLLFAIRPSGFKNFNGFAWKFRKEGIDIGYEPIQQEKPVRLLQAAPRS